MYNIITLLVLPLYKYIYVYICLRERWALKRISSGQGMSVNILKHNHQS